MLDQLLQLITRSGNDSVINNTAIPNEQNNEVLADAAQTITGGLRNVMAGGGLENILDIFKGQQGGTAGLLKNPMVTMMIGHFISKLVNKYNMSPAAASAVSNQLIPETLSGMITETNNPANPGFTLDGLIGSFTGGSNENGSVLQDLLQSFTGAGGNGDNSGNGFDMQDLIGSFTRKAQDSFQPQQNGGGGLMDLIRGFLPK